MIVLALDTTTPRGSVALWTGGSLAAVEPTDPARPYSEQLPSAFVALLNRHGLAVADVDVFAVASGPGSLTGLRVGIATVQGLAMACARRVVGVSALEALAHAAAKGPPPLAAGQWAGAMTDARRGEVFAALYQSDPGTREVSGLRLVDGPAVGPAEEVAVVWKGHLRDAALRVAGTGAATWLTAVRDRCGPSVELADVGLLAGTVATLAARRAAEDGGSLPHALQPLYVRRPDAELARERRRAERPLERGGRDGAR